MDATLYRALTVFTLTAAPLLAGPPAPLEKPVDARELKPLGKLQQPAGLRGIEPDQRLKRAFSLDPASVKGPPKADPQVQPASTNPTSPRAQELLQLYDKAERLAGRGRSVGDLADLLEECSRVKQKLGGGENLDLARLASWAHNRRGELLEAAGSQRQAFEDYQQAILLDSRNVAALVNRGVTLAQHGESASALADLTRAIKFDPASAVAYRNRAELHTERGDYQMAAGDYTAALANGPVDAALLTGRGFVRARLGQFEHAARDYNEALRLSPRDSETLVLRGALYAELGYYEQALSDLDTALSIAPKSVAAYQSIAWMMATCPDERFRSPHKSLEAARRAARFGPKGDPVLLDVLAAAHADAGLFEEAVRLQQQAAVIAPKEMKQDLQSRLELYRSGRAYRQPPARTAAPSGEQVSDARGK